MFISVTRLIYTAKAVDRFIFARDAENILLLIASNEKQLDFFLSLALHLFAGGCKCK